MDLFDGVERRVYVMTDVATTQGESVLYWWRAYVAVGAGVRK